MRYNIYLCRKCGGICAGREGASTFRCTYCGKENVAEKSRRLAAGIDSREIPAMMGKMKKESAERTKRLR